jgi:hypothetical protein
MTQQTWKPKVTPVGEMPSKPTQPGQVFTKTSLAATPQVTNPKRAFRRHNQIQNQSFDVLRNVFLPCSRI